MKRPNMNITYRVTAAVAVFLAAIVTVTMSQASPDSPTADSTGEVMTAKAQKALTPEQVLRDLKDGNARFVEGRLTPRDYLRQASATAADGQYPKAAVLGCVDSRVPPEIVLDQGIGDLFVGRIAGNFENADLLGSLEFATKVAGSKLIVVLGHTACGAVKGAVDDVELGHLTAMLNNIDDAVARADAAVDGPTSSSNMELVNAAVVENVSQTVADILAGSTIIAELVKNGDLLVVGAVYDLSTGRVDWLDD